MLNVVTTNKSLVEPFNGLFEAAFVLIKADSAPNWDSFSQQDNDKSDQELVDMENGQPTGKGFNEKNQNSQNYSETLSSQGITTILNDSKIVDKIR